MDAVELAHRLRTLCAATKAVSDAAAAIPGDEVEHVQLLAMIAEDLAKQILDTLP